MNEEEAGDAKRPAKRLKVAPAAAASASKSTLPLIFKLALPFCDQETLLLKLSEVSMEAKDVALNEIIRRFHGKKKRGRRGVYRDTLSLAANVSKIENNPWSPRFGSHYEDVYLEFSIKGSTNTPPTSFDSPRIKPFVTQWVQCVNEFVEGETVVPDPDLTIPDSDGGQEFDVQKVLHRLEQQGQVTIANQNDVGTHMEVLLSDIDLAPNQIKAAVLDPFSVFRHEHLASFCWVTDQNGDDSIEDPATNRMLKTIRLATKRVIQCTMKFACDQMLSSDNDHTKHTLKVLKKSNGHLEDEGYEEESHLYFQVPLFKDDGSLDRMVPMLLRGQAINFA